MGRKSTLSEDERRKADKLSSALREAARNADYEEAKEIFYRYNLLLKPHGRSTQTRLHKGRLWLWQSAIEAGELAEARRGLSLVGSGLNSNTRGYLEVLKLLAVLEIRDGKHKKAASHSRELIENISVIRTDSSRKDFQIDFVERIKDELVLSLIRANNPNPINPEYLEHESGKLVSKNISANELIMMMGKALPEKAKLALLKVEQEIRGYLPYESQRCLPPPESSDADYKYGKFLKRTMSRLIYPMLCQPKSKVQRISTKLGVQGLFGTGNLLAKKICNSFLGAGIDALDIAIPMMATVVTEKLDQFCKSTHGNTIL